MNNVEADEKLNKSNFFLVKNAVMINVFVVIALLGLMYLLKINKESILELIFKYYLN